MVNRYKSLRISYLISAALGLVWLYQHLTWPAATSSTTKYLHNEALSFVPPFQCDPATLPAHVRMMRRDNENYVLLGHGFKDIVTDWNWDTNGTGGWEDDLAFAMEDYMQAVISLDPSRDGFMDLGANIGTHSMYFASRGYRVDAFEPTYANYALMKCSLAISGIDGPVRFNTFGLGDKVETVCMDSVSWNMGDTRVDLTNMACGLQSRASIDTIDNYYHRHLRGRKQAVLKIDIQGFEIAALRNGKALFDSEEAPVVVFLEYEPIRLRAQNYQPPELIQYFRERDYTLWHFPNQTSFEDKDFDAFGDGKGYFDLVAVKNWWKRAAEQAGYTFRGGKISPPHRNRSPKVVYGSIGRK